MNTLLIDSYCSMLTSASLWTLKSRLMLKKSINRDAIARFLYNLSQSLAFGCVLGTAIMVTHQKHSLYRVLVPSTVIPCAISIATSGLTYMAKRYQHCSQEMEYIDQNLGNFMDFATQVSSFALLLILAPHAEKIPIRFSLTAAVIFLNLKIL
jgi:hypothetical protein